MTRPDAMTIEAVHPLASAPRTGEPFWAGLRDDGIAKARWWSAEAIAEVEGGSASRYQEGFYLLADPTSECHPVWWLAINSLPDPHGEGVRFVATGGSHAVAVEAARASDTGRSEAEEDDSFSHELQAAYARNDADGYARVLSGRLRQMDKRARAANVRADQTEVRLRLMRVRAEAAEAERLAGRTALSPPAGQGERT